VPFDDAVATTFDCVIVATDHDMFDYERIAGMPLVLDTRNALKRFDRPSIFRL
jgi:UDP-N-acetyl-D-mannosaminuronate dehydrogenase